MEADVVARLGVKIEGASMRVIVWAGHHGHPHQPTDEIDKRWGAIQVEENRRLFRQGVVADTPPLLVFRNVVAMNLSAELLDVREEVMFNYLGRQKLFQVDTFVLLPIRAVRMLKIECLDGTWDLL